MISIFIYNTYALEYQLSIYTKKKKKRNELIYTQKWVYSNYGRLC